MESKAEKTYAKAAQTKRSRHYLEHLEHIVLQAVDACYRRYLQDGCYDFVTPSVETLTGFSPSELTFEEVVKRIHPDDRAHVLEVSQAAQADPATPGPHEVEFRFRHRNGEYRWFNNRFSIEFNKQHKAVAAVGIVRDITVTRQLYEALRLSEERYRNLYNNARVALYRSRIEDGKVIECNEMQARMLGYDTPEQCMAEFFSSKSYVDPAFRDRFIEELKRNGVVKNIEAAVRRRDGSICWARFSARIYPELGYLEGAAIDITDNKLLTKTETTVLTLVMRGMSNTEIAGHLDRSSRTIEDQRAKIMRKLGVKNLVELTKRAVEMGLTTE